jgi:MFS family permease
MLATFPYPQNFAYTFLVAAIAITLSWVSLALAREPAQPLPDHIRQKGDQSRQKIKAILRRDDNFRTFLSSRLLSNLGRMGAGFLTVAAIQQWQVSDASVGLYTAVLLIGQTLGNLLAGMIADRRGHKFTLELAQWASILTFGMAWLAPHPDWYYGIFFLMGIVNGVMIVSGVLIVMEFSEPEHRPTYIGLGNTVTGIGGAVAPLIGGLLAVYSYNLLFLASALFSAITLLVLYFGMKEPRKHVQRSPFEERVL